MPQIRHVVAKKVVLKPARLTANFCVKMAQLANPKKYVQKVLNKKPNHIKQLLQTADIQRMGFKACHKG